MGWDGHVTRMVGGRSVHRFVVGNPGENRPLEMSRRRREDNIKMDLEEFGWKHVDWTDLAHDRG